MKPILVTGGTGFVGANVVRELVALGAGVRVLARPGGDRRALDGLPVEIVEGDLLDRASLERAVTGADTLYHVAADYRLWARDPAELHRVKAEEVDDGTVQMGLLPRQQVAAGRRPQPLGQIYNRGAFRHEAAGILVTLSAGHSRHRVPRRYVWLHYWRERRVRCAHDCTLHELRFTHGVHRSTDNVDASAQEERGRVYRLAAPEQA